MKTLVLGGTGNVGTLIVRGLLSRGGPVRLLTRDPQHAVSLGGAEVVTGDLLDVGTVRTMCQGVDAVMITIGPSEAVEGPMAVSAAMNAGVRRLVYLSVLEADRAGYVPHFTTKAGVEVAVKHSGIPYTILRPCNFFQNDLRMREPITHFGVYPQPIGGVGVSRVDIRDVAEAAVIALTEDGHVGKTIDIVGPRPLTGAEVAAIWSEALGRRVQYAGDDLDRWEQQMLQMLPPAVVYAFRLMYRHFQEHGFQGRADDVATLTKLTGHAPRTFEAFATETAAAWVKEGAAAGQP